MKEEILNRHRETLTRSVDEMELSVGSYNRLQNADIKTIGDLVQRKERELLKIKNFGRKHLNEIKELLAVMGLQLGMKLEEEPSTRWKDSAAVPIPEETTVGRAIRILDSWSLWLPRRIAKEDMGGYIEEIHERSKRGDARWKIYLRTLAALFWTTFNALKELAIWKLLRFLWPGSE